HGAMIAAQDNGVITAAAVDDDGRRLDRSVRQFVEDDIVVEVAGIDDDAFDFVGADGGTAVAGIADRHVIKVGRRRDIARTALRKLADGEGPGLGIAGHFQNVIVGIAAAGFAAAVHAVVAVADIVQEGVVALVAPQFIVAGAADDEVVALLAADTV